MRLSDFDYDLPERLIAQNPANPRDSCRLLILDRKTHAIQHDTFENLSKYLSKDDLLVLNNSRVIPARLYGKKESGGEVEFLLLQELQTNLWECLVRPGRRLPLGTRVYFNGKSIAAEILARNENGTRHIRFSGVDDIRTQLEQLGQLPYPPYITKATCNPEEYQTVYSKFEGSVAAPTAGLHFTDALLQTLLNQGIGFAEVTLHVGWGTFRPVKSESITEHTMEKEWFSISKKESHNINKAEEMGKRLVAVGTTATRVLESLPPGPIQSQSNWTNLYVTPGFCFTRIGALITNFHLPRTTLLMLVCAFAGRNAIFNAYNEAIRQSYRFYSFGDAMLIL